MVKNKLIALVTSAVLFAGGVGVTALASNKTNHVTTKVENHVLLSAPATSNQAVVINTNKSPLVLYSAPNSSSSVASYLSIGEMLTYQTTNNANFYKVTVQETGATGYISANNIQIIESGLNQAFNDMSGQGQVINVTRNVILRSQPDMQGSIMGNYKNNMPITLLGKQGQWYKVTIGGQVGYMYQEYVGIDNSSNGNVTTNSNSGKATMNNNSGNAKSTAIISSSHPNININTNTNNSTNGKSPINTTSNTSSNANVTTAKTSNHNISPSKQIRNKKNLENDFTFYSATINKDCSLYEAPPKLGGGASVNLQKGEKIFVNMTDTPQSGWILARTALGGGYLPTSSFTESSSERYLLEKVESPTKLYSKPIKNSATISLNSKLSYIPNATLVFVLKESKLPNGWSSVFVGSSATGFKQGYIPTAILSVY